MTYDRSDGQIPRDWRFILGLQFAFAFGVPMVALAVGMFLPISVRAREGDLTLFWIALASALVGITLLILAKLPLYRQGRYFAFGPRALPEKHRTVYRIAYICISASLFSILSLLAVLE